MVNTSKFLGKPKTLNGKKRLEYQPYDVNSRKNRVKPSGDDEKVDVVDVAPVAMVQEEPQEENSAVTALTKPIKDVDSVVHGHVDHLPAADECQTSLANELNKSGIDKSIFNKVKLVWKKRISHDARDLEVVRTCGVSLKQSDLMTIKYSEKLNDEIINVYMNLIDERSKKFNKIMPKTYSFSSFFWSSYSPHGHARVARWTRNVNIFDYDLLLMPVHEYDHWAMLAVDLENNCIVYYDSMEFLAGEFKQFGKMILKKLADYLEAEAVAKQQNEHIGKKYRKCLVNRPVQPNDTDCGVYALTFAEYVSRRCTCFDFEHRLINRFRIKMCGEILAGRLMWAANGPKLNGKGELMDQEKR